MHARTIVAIILSGGLGALSVVVSLIAVSVLYYYQLLRKQEYRVLAYTLMVCVILSLTVVCNDVVVYDDISLASFGSIIAFVRLWSVGALYGLVSWSVLDLCCLSVAEIQPRGTLAELVTLSVCVSVPFCLSYSLLCIDGYAPNELEYWTNFTQLESVGGTFAYNKTVFILVLAVQFSLAILSVLIHFSCIQIFTRLVKKSLSRISSANEDVVANHMSSAARTWHGGLGYLFPNYRSYRQALKEVTPLLLFPCVVPFSNNLLIVYLFIGSYTFYVSAPHLILDSLLGMLNGTTVIAHVFLLNRSRLNRVSQTSNDDRCRINADRSAFIPGTSTNLYTTFHLPHEDDESSLTSSSD